MLVHNLSDLESWTYHTHHFADVSILPARTEIVAVHSFEAIVPEYLCSVIRVIIIRTA